MDAAPRLYLDQVVAPTPSLPKRGFLVLIGALVVLNVMVGTMFVLMGAPPIPVFLGIDILAVVLAFRASYRRARDCERVQISADHVRVTRQKGPRAETVWSSPTAFTRVRLEEDERYGAQVRLMLSGRRCVVGQALGPRERAGLAEAIEDAIRSARQERWN